MIYSWSTHVKPGGGIEYGIKWKGRFDPVAVCADVRDAQRIVDALNAAEKKSHEEPQRTQSYQEWNWVSVEDRLPDYETEVLVVTRNENLHLAYRNAEKWYECGTCDSVRIADKAITHWCDPIPPAEQLNNQQPSNQ